jgi:plastocyanin
MRSWYRRPPTDQDGEAARVLRNHRLLLTIVASALVLGIIGAACNAGGVGSTPATDLGGTPVLTAAANLTYTPTQLTVAAGGRLIVRNTSGAITHSFTVDSTTIDLTLEPSTTFKIPIDLDPGIYDFHCRFHRQMHGTITVR